MFALLIDWLGDRPLLLGIAYVFVGIASFGGIAVWLGGYLIHADRVRTGRFLILLGSGAGFLTLVVFLVANIRREEFSYLFHVLPAVLGVAVGVAARFRAHAKPIL